jgi:hypothetical protein
MTIPDERAGAARSTPRDSEPEAVVADPAYLDLDGDGVPDAVRTIHVEAFDVDGDGVADVVEIIQEVDAEIDDDGAPHVVTVTDTLGLDVDPTSAQVVIGTSTREVRPPT